MANEAMHLLPHGYEVKCQGMSLTDRKTCSGELVDNSDLDREMVHVAEKIGERVSRWVRLSPDPFRIGIDVRYKTVSRCCRKHTQAYYSAVITRERPLQGQQPVKNKDGEDCVFTHSALQRIAEPFLESVAPENREKHIIVLFFTHVRKKSLS